MRGFKDDFYAWKDSLSKDEQALILKQAQNEFDKKFRKSDEFSQDLPEEKIQSFAKVLKKFFDNAARLGWYSAPPALESLEVVPDIPNVPEHAGLLSDVVMMLSVNVGAKRPRGNMGASSNKQVVCAAEEKDDYKKARLHFP